MVSRSTLRWNVDYVRAVNKCDRASFIQLFQDAMEQDVKGLFTRKRYLWNLIRGKDFYKNMAYYIINQAKEAINIDCQNREEILDRLDSLIKSLLASEKRYEIRKSLVWNITKHVPLITVDTIDYMSTERITNIIRSDKAILCDSALNPFVNEIADLRRRVADAEDLVNTITMNDI